MVGIYDSLKEVLVVLLIPAALFIKLFMLQLIAEVRSRRSKVTATSPRRRKISKVMVYHIFKLIDCTTKVLYMHPERSLNRPTVAHFKSYLDSPKISLFWEEWGFRSAMTFLKHQL